MAIPGEYFFDPPAKEKVIGKTAETPIPTKEKPMRTGQNSGRNIANNIPTVTIEAPKTKVFFIPILSINRSE